MVTPVDPNDQSNLFGEDFDLGVVLSRGRSETVGGHGTPSVRRPSFVALRHTAGRIAIISAIQLVVAMGFAAATPSRSGVVLASAAAIGGVYAGWLLFTPVPTALRVVATALAISAVAQTALLGNEWMSVLPGSDGSHRWIPVAGFVAAWAVLAIAIRGIFEQSRER